MNEDILPYVKFVSNERGIEEDVVFKALEKALATIFSKRDDLLIRVEVDRATGKYKVYRQWVVVEEVELEAKEITLEEAHKMDESLELGDIIEDSEVLSVDPFRRDDANQAGQIIRRIVNEATNAKLMDEYRKDIGKLITIRVKRVLRDGVVADLGEYMEGLMLRQEMLPREIIRPRDCLRCYIYDVREDKKGPQVLLSRVRPEVLIKLFEVEVREIAEELIQIKAVAREPGYRSKIAVKTNDGRMDPIGACVGMRGSRVQAISEELSGERIDIVLWDDDPAQFVINAMSPAKVLSVVVDEDAHSMDVAVEPDRLDQAIGRGGQNVRLVSELTGWTLNVMSIEELEDRHAQGDDRYVRVLMKELAIAKEVASVLVREGLRSVQDIASGDMKKLLEVDGFDQEVIDGLSDQANNVLLAQAITQSQETEQEDVSALCQVEGMTDSLLAELEAIGVLTREDLAEKAVDELSELTLGETETAALIMRARAHWFDGKKQAEGE